MPVSSVVIADDHPLIRTSLAELLERDLRFKLIGEAEDGIEALSKVKALRPDLLILDLKMPLSSGIETFAEVKRWAPKTKVLILTASQGPALLSQLYEAGVDGLISKDCDARAVLDALSDINKGERVIDPALLERLNTVTDGPSFTPREFQILDLIVNGLNNSDISKRLHISPKTVDRHRTNIMSKAGVHSVAQLIVFTLRNDLLTELN
ncbi:MAG: response regulator transcription factor [Pseudomonadota bacterium]